MKKALSVFFMAAIALLLGFSVNAASDTTGDLVIHYHNWDNDYTDLGSHAWGDTAAPKETFDGTDDFGVYFNYPDVAVGTSVGFIAVEWANGAQNWDAKHTGDVNLDDSVVIANKVVHVYVFENANNQYLVADPDQYNMLLTYFDPSGAYEDTLGVHAWNGWSGYQMLDETSEDWTNAPIVASWGSPDPVFMTVGKASDGTEVKAAMLTTATAPTSDATPGLLIYAGADGNKKTGDVNAYPALGDTPTLGEAGVAYVVSKGDAYTAGDNIFFNDPVSFFTEAFSFRLVAFNAAENTGTYAANPNSIIVKTSATITNPYAEAETEEAQTAAVATIEGWFTLTEVLTVNESGEALTYGDEVTIDRVDFALSNTTLQDFVIVLSDTNALDNTKMYEIAFNLGEEGDANKEAAIMVDMDTEAPVLEFTYPTSFTGADAASRVIEIELGSDWNQAWFPRYAVNDNRDGDLSSFVFVPAGDNSTLNTGELGDYTIMLQVSDKWGNVTQVTFIFRVVEGSGE